MILSLAVEFRQLKAASDVWSKSFACKVAEQSLQGKIFLLREDSDLRKGVVGVRSGGGGSSFPGHPDPIVPLISPHMLQLSLYGIHIYFKDILV